MSKMLKAIRKLIAPKKTSSLTLNQLFWRYNHELPAGAIELNTRATLAIHQKHLLKVFGKDILVEDIKPSTYIRERSCQTFRNKPIGSRTIRKELATLRALCNWAAHPNQGLITTPPNFTKLVFEKEDAQRPFLSWGEIETKIKQGSSPSLWDSLFLSVEETRSLLEFVRAATLPPFVYPLFCFAALTGARRSEMLRCRLEDLALDKGEIVLREKKRCRTFKETFRRVFAPPSLVEAISNWLLVHPGDNKLFLLSPSMASFWFKESLRGSKWEVISGWHCLRHSTASNLAAAGTDPRIIDALLGHMSRSMRDRYSHLFPSNVRDAVSRIYQ